MPGAIIRGAQIGPGGQGQGPDETLADLAAADLATIEQQVAIFGKRAADDRELPRAVGQLGLGQLGCAQLQPARGAVADQVDRLQPPQVRHRLGDLRQTVAFRIEHQRTGIAAQPSEEPGVVRYARVDEDQRARRPGQRLRRPHRQAGTGMTADDQGQRDQGGQGAEPEYTPHGGHQRATEEPALNGTVGRCARHDGAPNGVERGDASLPDRFAMAHRRPSVASA